MDGNGAPPIEKRMTDPEIISRLTAGLHVAGHVIHCIVGGLPGLLYMSEDKETLSIPSCCNCKKPPPHDIRLGSLQFLVMSVTQVHVSIRMPHRNNTTLLAGNVV
jgi:hypothetical protein